jgi:hypothetical protein
MTTTLPIRNAFICLRPDIFGHENEHVTLEYLGHEPDIYKIELETNYWTTTFAGLPVTVAVNGYANWRAKDDYHHVALIEFKEYPALSFSKNWHITLESSRQPIPAYTFDTETDAFRYDYADSLWLGYKDVLGQKKFILAEKAHTLVRELA